MVESRGLKLDPLRPDHIFMFRPHPSSAHELSTVYGLEIKKALVGRLNVPDVYAVVGGNTVYAITGLSDDGHMWSVFSKEIDGNFVKMARASRELIRFYHEKSRILSCDVWSENISIMDWLLLLGFDPISTYLMDDHRMVRFVRCAV